nr:MAG TPA: hypothetical protein [Bacteriophage sp.]
MALQCHLLYVMCYIKMKYSSDTSYNIQPY